MLNCYMCSEKPGVELAQDLVPEFVSSACSLSASAVPQGSHGLRRAQRNRFSGCDCSLGYVLISSYSKSRLGIDMPACGKDGVYPADQAGVPDE